MIPSLLLAYFYCQWFQADTVENRKRVVLGYKVYFISWVILCIVFIGVVVWLPQSYLPRDYVEIDGKKHILTDEDKRTIKFWLIIFAVIVSILVSYLQFYFYRVAKKWATMEKLISDYQWALDRNRTIFKQMKAKIHAKTRLHFYMSFLVQK